MVRTLLPLQGAPDLSLVGELRSQMPCGATKKKKQKKKNEQQKKIDKLELIKMKNFCASNDTIKKVKRQPTQ